jgi:hypothetical protein
VALTAYEDEASIVDAVRDFRSHPLVEEVIVVGNSSSHGRWDQGPLVNMIRSGGFAFMITTEMPLCARPIHEKSSLAPVCGCIICRAEKDGDPREDPDYLSRCHAWTYFI